MTAKKTILLALILCATATANPPYTLDWKYTTKGSVSAVQAADLNDDGQMEILAAGLDGYLYVLSNTGVVRWKHYNHCQVFSLLVTDIESDGKPEILVGGCRHLELLDHTGEQIWKSHIGNEIHDIICRDLDDDGINEIITASKSFSGTQGTLNYVSPEGETIWQKTYKTTHPSAIATGNLDFKDGEEVIAGSKTVTVYTREGEFIWSFDAEQQIDSLEVTPEFDVIVGALKNLYILDFEGKKKKHIQTNSAITDIAYDDNFLYIASDRLYKISRISDKIKDTHDINEDLYDIKLIDFDKDGDMELIAGSKNINFYDPKKFNVIWNYTPYRSVTDIRLADTNGDGFLEAIMGSRDHNIYYIKTTTRHQHNVLAQRFYQMGLDAEKEGMRETAISYIEKSLKYAPADEKYVRVMERLQQEEEEEKIVEEIRDLYEDSRKLLAEKKLDEARATAQKALEEFSRKNDAEGVRKTLELIDDIEKSRPTTRITTLKKEKASSYLWIMPIIVLLILIAVFIHEMKK